MTPELNAENVGQTLGFEGVGSVVAKVEEYCAYEERRITLANEPKILSLRAEIAILQDEERTLEGRIKNTQPPSDVRNRCRKAVYYWTVAVLLAIAAFVFSLLAFDPYRLGWKSYLYCLGIAIVMPFLIEVLSLIFLAIIRGDLLAHEVNTSNQVMVTDDSDTAPPPDPQHDFYGETVALLRLAMALLAVAMELGGGLALHRAWRTTENSGEDWKALRGELRTVREQMVALATEMAILQNEPAVFVSKFWRNFYHAMLTHTVRNAMAKLFLGLLLVTLPAFHGRANAQEQTTMVIALDLTRSVASKGPAGKTDFEENIEGVTRVLAQVPSNCRMTVIGITDQSFTRPYILFSAHVMDDPGYFGERLRKARSELIRRWKTRAAQLTADFRSTDIVGAFFLAGQILNEAKGAERKILIVFSDMRNTASPLNLESVRVVPAFAAINTRNILPIASLQDAEVWLLGVDGAGKSVAYWQSLERFWAEYVKQSKANLREYSALRNPPAFGSN